MAEPSRRALSLDVRTDDDALERASAGGVSDVGGSLSGAGSRWVDSSDDEEGNPREGDEGRSVPESGTKGAGPRDFQSGKKEMESDGAVTAGEGEGAGGDEGERFRSAFLVLLVQKPEFYFLEKRITCALGTKECPGGRELSSLIKASAPRRTGATTHASQAEAREHISG